MKNVSIAVFSRYAVGILAMAMAMLFIYFYRNSFSILAASAYLFLICATDTIYSKIPNIFTVIFITVGFFTNIIISGLPGVFFSVTGFIVGIALLLIPFLMGGMGAGDVKALAALGAFLGPSMTFHIFLYMGCIGGLLGLFFHILSSDIKEEVHHYITSIKTVYLTRSCKLLRAYKNRTTYRFPYATSIAFGYFALIHWGKIF